jgi:hypothetical protein
MQTIIEDSEVFDAIRRGYGELSNASDDEILEYFEAVDVESLQGHVGNIKGILFEQEYAQQLQAEGIDARVFEETNHPLSDIGIYEDGELVEELQLKATQNPSYIDETLTELPEGISVVTTSEVVDGFGDEVIDSGISETLLEESVNEVIMPVSPLSVIGWCFGIFC